MFSSNLIFGTILLLFGISLILKAFFGISIPIFRPLFGLFLIYLGLSMIFNWNSCKTICKKKVFFNKGYMHVYGSDTLENNYSINFGQGIIDLSRAKLPLNKSKIDIDIAFGSATLKLNASIPTKIKINSSFASIYLPEENVVSFGTHTYSNYTQDQEPLLAMSWFR